MSTAFAVPPLSPPPPHTHLILEGCVEQYAYTRARNPIIQKYINTKQSTAS